MTDTSENLECRLQADFSGCLVREQGPVVMGFAYLSHLAKSSPRRAVKTAFTMGRRFLEYRLDHFLSGRENLEKVFSVYAGMPQALLEESARALTLNPKFLAFARAYRKERGLDYCVVDICTRDAADLVEAFRTIKGEDMAREGILMGSVLGNELEYSQGICTGKSTVFVTIGGKAGLLSPEYPYIAGPDERRWYGDGLGSPKIRAIWL